MPIILVGVPAVRPANPSPAPSSPPAAPANAREQHSNWHVQNTDIVQSDPSFPALYSGPNSLNSNGEVQETVSLDLFGGARLGRALEAHMDALMWQGFGLSKTFGIESFPNGDAYKAGTMVPNFVFARLFLRQTIGLGGAQEDVPDDQLTLAGKEDVSRITLTLGRFTPKDMFDNNAYANDPHTQFMNWAFLSNSTWDYAADSVGYTTGLAAELNQAKWTLRYGFFQMPGVPNSFSVEDQFLKWPNGGTDGPFFTTWGMAGEFERRYNVNTHPGTVRLLSWLNEANMSSYQAATAILLANGPGADISATRAYRYKYGFGLSWDQEVLTNVGVFSRVGWNDGQTTPWNYTDTNHSASVGVSVKGGWWHRPDDTFALAGCVSGISSANEQFLKAGGTGILDGDGALNYGYEKNLETYYDFKIWKSLHGAVDYQYVVNPAFNRDRGPVSIFGARLHWEL